MTETTGDLPFDLRSLEIFLAVCAAGSMAAAARRLRLTQPAISLAVAELERRTGSLLFDRAVRPLALTPAGGLLRQRAAVLLADAREIPSLLRGTVRGRVPQLSVGLVDSLTRAVSVELAQWLASRAEQVAVLSGLTASHAGALLTRRLDMFVGVDDLEDTPGLERFVLAREPYVLLLSKGVTPPHTVAELKRLASELPFVRFSARSQTGLDVDRHLRRLGLEPPRNLEFDTPFGVAASVARGKAFALTTPLCNLEAHVRGGLQTVILPGPRLSRTLTLVARQRELGDIPRELAGLLARILSGVLASSSHVSG